MRDTKIHRQKGSNAGLVFVIILTIITAIYSYFRSNPQEIKQIPGIGHFDGHVYEKSNAQKRRDYNETKTEKTHEASTLISDADRLALRMLLEAAQ